MISSLFNVHVTFTACPVHTKRSRNAEGDLG
jgi:hypothetical protein